MLNEKIFIFLYYWLFALLFSTCGSFIYFLYTILFRSSKGKFIKHHLIVYAKELRDQIDERKEQWRENHYDKVSKADNYQFYCNRNGEDEGIEIDEELSIYPKYFQIDITALSEEERLQNSSKSRANHRAIVFEYPSLKHLFVYRIFIQKIGASSNINARNPKLPLRYRFKGGMQEQHRNIENNEKRLFYFNQENNYLIDRISS